MKKSLKDRIIKFLRNDFTVWHNGGEIEKLAMGAGYKGSTASRVCRQLAEVGIIEREEKIGEHSRAVSVWYKAKPPVRYNEIWAGGELKETVAVWEN
jgi:predicted transcriptional regulator